MIERLNFYDLYGYLLPGLALLGVLWFPLWFVADEPLPAEWSSALLTLALAYITGHLLQQTARSGFPHGIKGTDGTRRFPSDYLLDVGTDWIPADYPSDLRRQHLIPDIRTRVAALIQQTFVVDVNAPGIPDAGSRERRNGAFLLCRRALLHRKAGSYAEQFEGMYALMRGLAAVAALSIFYTLGWALGLSVIALAPGTLAYVWGYLALGLVTAVALLYDHGSLWMFWSIVGLFVLIGVHLGTTLGSSSTPGMEGVGILVAVAVGSSFAGWQFFGSYKGFELAFAATVYRDFYVLMRAGGTER